MRGGHAPSLASRLVATGQSDVAKMGAAMGTMKITDEEFPAPDLAVGSKTGSVKSHPDDFFVQAVFRHATGDVGVVMLNRQFRLRAAEGPASAEVIGMEIMSDQARIRLINALQIAERFFKELQRFVIFQVADVLARNGIAAFSNA